MDPCTYQAWKWCTKKQLDYWNELYVGPHLKLHGTEQGCSPYGDWFSSLQHRNPGICKLQSIQKLHIAAPSSLMDLVLDSRKDDSGTRTILLYNFQGWIQSGYSCAVAPPFQAAARPTAWDIKVPKSGKNFSLHSPLCSVVHPLPSPSLTAATVSSSWEWEELQSHSCPSPAKQHRELGSAGDSTRSEPPCLNLCSWASGKHPGEPGCGGGKGGGNGRGGEEKVGCHWSWRGRGRLPTAGEGRFLSNLVKKS